MFLQLLVSGILLGIGFYFGADAISRVLNAPKLPALLRIFAWYPLFMLPTMVVESVLVTENRPVTSVIFGAIMRVTMFCTLVIPTMMKASLAETVGIWVSVAGVMGGIAVIPHLQYRAGSAMVLAAGNAA